MLLNARPTIFEDECLSSYLYRLAYANAHASGNVYARKLGMTVSNINNNEFSEQAVKTLSEMTCYPPPELKKHTAIQQEKRSKEESPLRRRMRFCPLCLGENRYHRSAWNLNWNTVCLKHGIMLKDKCECGRITSLHSVMINGCLSCGKALIRETAKKG
ncbi:TniQ family protein [Cohnella ginsengisoli]|uniref:TniQ family protein n=1 Tax=Cohnella ginsengisoli TaxID=425004 RepID=UPI003B8A93D1